MMDTREREPAWLTPFRRLVTAVRLELIQKKNTNISDSDLAVHFGVSAASFSAWLNGVRKPDQVNTAQLARTLGPELFDIMGYDRVYKIDNLMLRTIIENFSKLSDQLQEEIYERVIHYRPPGQGGNA